MKSLIVGMGIGQLYKTVLTQLGHDIVTLDTDPAKAADFTDIEQALAQHTWFDTVHICTPNFTHESIARQVASVASIVFIEKPGLANKQAWQALLDDFPATRFILVKNNMWRDNIAELQARANSAEIVNIDWIRKNCIPSPGSWFTNRQLAFGGVSRDLMPHLLSWYVALNPNWRTEKLSDATAIQNWSLDRIESTEYGTVYPNGTYDVDDECRLAFGGKWRLTANWRSTEVERSAITFVDADTRSEVFELGWCPEYAYLNMISDAIKNLNNQEFWDTQREIDTWIHQRIETL